MDTGMAEHDRRVSALERDLRFFPAHPADGRVLSAADVDRFNERGFLAGLPALNESEMRDVRTRFDQLLETFLRSGRNSYAIDRYQDRIAMIHDCATHPRIVDVVSDLIGPDVICWATHFFCKLPGDPREVAWHQDCSYWALTPSRTVTVWLAIDDVDTDNGCMRVLPGSHLHGHLPWRETAPDEDNVLTQAIDAIADYGEPEDVQLRSGEISIHSDLLVHGSRANMSDRRRCGLTLRYCPPSVRAYWDWNRHSIVCRGSDPSGHWADVPRPDDTAPFEFRES